jgi:hypothetical protein
MRRKAINKAINKVKFDPTTREEGNVHIRTIVDITSLDLIQATIDMAAPNIWIFGAWSKKATSMPGTEEYKWRMEDIYSTKIMTMAEDMRMSENNNFLKSIIVMLE